MSESYRADARCANCGKDYADHNYAEGKPNPWSCPEQQYEDGYGGFHGGDPRNFYPDCECCSEEEIENHRQACAAWDAAEAAGSKLEPEKCESGWQLLAGSVVHVFQSRFGIGCYRWPIESYFEPFEGSAQEKAERYWEEFQ